MARINNLTNFLTDVASAIKTKKEDLTDIPAASFDTEILALPSQGTYEQRTINITHNGSQTITPDTGYDAIDSLTINTNIPLQIRNYTFTQNTTTTLTPEQGYDGFSEVGLTISVDADETTATANDIISPKTAYSNHQKITGAMVPTYDVNSLTIDTVTTTQTVSNIYDVDVTDNLLLLKNGSNIDIVNMTTNTVVYTISSSYTLSDARFGSILSNNTIIVWAAYKNGDRTFVGNKVIVDLANSTETVHGFSWYVGNYSGYGNSPKIIPHPTDQNKAMYIAHYLRYREIGGNPTTYTYLLLDTGSALSYTRVATVTATDLSAGTALASNGYWNTERNIFYDNKCK